MSQQNIQVLLTRVPVLTLNLESKYFLPRAPCKWTVGFGPLPIKTDLTECLSHRHFESPSRFSAKCPGRQQHPRFHDSTFPCKYSSSLRLYFQDSAFSKFLKGEQIISPVKLLTLVWSKEEGFVPKTSYSESDDALPLPLHMASLSKGLSLNMQWLLYVINMLV